MQTRCKNHNIIIKNLKTRFNRGAKNHNIVLQKHKMMLMLCLCTISLSFALSNRVYADDTITITLPSSSVNLPITPTSSGVFNSTDINVQVTTSNTAGYTLSMTAADVNLTRTAAVNGATPTIPTFTSLSGYTSGTTYSQANFPTGYWGYKLSSDTNYSPLASSITIADPDESTANTAISNVITFAAKLDNSKPAGSYTTTLTFTATGKTPPVQSHTITLSLTNPDTPSAFEFGYITDNYAITDYYLKGLQIYGNILESITSPTQTITFTTTSSKIGIGVCSKKGMLDSSRVSVSGGVTHGTTRFLDDIAGQSCATIGQGFSFDVTGDGSITIDQICYDD